MSSLNNLQDSASLSLRNKQEVPLLLFYVVRELAEGSVLHDEEVVLVGFDDLGEGRLPRRAG